MPRYSKISSLWTEAGRLIDPKYKPLPETTGNRQLNYFLPGIEGVLELCHLRWSRRPWDGVVFQSDQEQFWHSDSQ